MDLRRASMMVFGAKIVSTLAGFIAVIVFSRALGAAALGTYYPFVALLGIVSIVTDFGLGNAVEKRISEGEHEEIYLGTCVLLKSVLLILITVVIFSLQDYVNLYLGEDLALLLIVALFVNEGGRLALYVLRGELRVGETAVAKVLRPLGWLVFGYLFYLLGYGVYGIVYGYILGMTAMMIVGWWKVSVSLGRLSVKHAKSLFDFGKYTAITTVGGFVYSWMDVAILALFVTLELAATRASIGAYENAWRLSLVVSLLARSFSMAIFPQISRWDAEDAVDRIEETIPLTILASLLIAVPGFVGVLVLSNDLLELLFGPEFVIASTALIILMGEKVFQSIQVILSRSLRGIDRPDLAAYATAVTIVVNLVLNVVLIYLFGIAGAAAATGIAIAVNMLFHIHYLNRFLDLDFPLRKIAWSGVASAVMGVVLYAVHAAVEIQTVAQLFAIVIFGMAVYGVVLVGHPALRTQLWSATRPVVAKLAP